MSRYNYVKCSLPNCHEGVDYHRVKTNKSGTNIRISWKNLCEKHRRKGIGRDLVACNCSAVISINCHGRVKRKRGCCSAAAFYIYVKRGSILTRNANAPNNVKTSCVSRIVLSCCLNPSVKVGGSRHRQRLFSSSAYWN